MGERTTRRSGPGHPDERCGQGFTTRERFVLRVASGCLTGPRERIWLQHVRAEDERRAESMHVLATRIAVAWPVSPSSQGGVPDRGWFVEVSSAGESADTAQSAVRYAREWSNAVARCHCREASSKRSCHGSWPNSHPNIPASSSSRISPTLKSPRAGSPRRTR